jgi:hypothetical protein
MIKGKEPQAVKLDAQELEALKQRISAEKITRDDLKLFLKLIEFNLWLQVKLGRAKLSIHRLRKMFGFKSEKRKKEKEEDASDDNKDNIDADKEDDTPEESKIDTEQAKLATIIPGERKPKEPEQPKWDPAANHGRYGFDDYSGCETITIEHQSLSAGMTCPECEKDGCHGRLYEPDDTFATYIVLEGQSIITGKRYQARQYRCSFCGEYYKAEIPAAVKSRSSRYDESCATTLAIHRYYLGLPFKRIEKAQEMQNIPVPDATQWDKVLQAWHKVKPVYQALRISAAEGQPCFDDTSNKIMLSTPLPNGRKGIYTTAMVSRFEKNDIFLFHTSHQYAGENVADVFSARKSKELICSMSDASANNIPKRLDEDFLSRWIFCFCLAHGRRKFFELLGQFDQESDFVLEVIGGVYKHDKHCRDNGLSNTERLHYHQTFSAPLMQSLWSWLNNRRIMREVEDNSGLGEAIKYMLKHWQALTQFLRRPGALIDNNLCERAIKVVIRHRRNSLFFRTFLGAEVGDGFMSIIHTAVMANIDAFNYLNTLQIYHKQVALAPEQWLPWCYVTSLERLTADKAA